ncbi:hypothetical protein IVB15_07450 [Bradyrhizobium sp. 182]|uniref:hypothetical protein n=1 Tax=unclassified Bradyrhizobium TaxID=2631580 RepID=UPI001FF80CD5|nr:MULTISPECIES: hypothetical protein [unclassified Bradyrhizobium]MCK1419624.1 hypothetical protein [Bradyrhizobium sp. CW12]MCK1527585.1 hypothetical protein [Bradyrhizobium sp. 182]MCK1648230.1 hypothetical protein [Bradyrhizobium sp. 154]
MDVERERTDKRNGKQQAFEHGLPPDAPEVSLSRLDGRAAGFVDASIVETLPKSVFRARQHPASGTYLDGERYPCP